MKKQPTREGLVPGRGLDVGTSFLLEAHRTTEGEIVTSKVRDAFIDLPSEPLVRNMVKSSGVTTLERDGKLLVIGDRALEFANLFKREARRPLQKGFLNPEELAVASDILLAVFRSLLGDPVVEGETVCYSVPANPVDNKEASNIYHERAVGKIIESLGYKPVAVNEALAVIYAECASTNFTGIGISFGAGMVNTCMSYLTMPVSQFSFQLGGDFIDKSVAAALNTTASRIQTIKEKGLDLLATSFSTREEEAIAFYYHTLVTRTVEYLVSELNRINVDLTDPVPIVIGGGTSLCLNFVELFKRSFDQYRSRLPFEVSEIRHAGDAHTTVARGLLVASQLGE